MVVRADATVRLELNGEVDGFVRPVKFELPHLQVYQNAVAAHEELELAAETLHGLRERQHEIVLSGGEALSRKLLLDPRVRGEVPETVAVEHLHARFVERLRAGGVRLHLTGDAYHGILDFEDLGDFNRASGLALSPNDFWRELLSFWRGHPHEMSGGFVMKAREEASVDCERALREAPDHGPE